MPHADAASLIRTCSIWRALEVVGDVATLLILEAAWIGARRFDDLRSRTGLARPLLADRLRRLVAAGLLARTPYAQRPLRHDYRLTPKGEELYWTALMMLRWEQRWGTGAGKIRIVLNHRRCGKDCTPVPRCAACHSEISARDTRWQAGPGVGWMAARYSRRRQQRAAAPAASGLMDSVAQITGDRWASLILRSIFTGIRRFDEIRRDTGMATNILAERLGWLVATGVLRQQAYSSAPPRHEYRLTEKGIDYFPILLMLLQWGDRHYVAPEGPPLLLFHHSDGHALAPEVVCSACAQPLAPRDVRVTLVEAPAFAESPVTCISEP